MAVQVRPSDTVTPAGRPSWPVWVLTALIAAGLIVGLVLVTTRDAVTPGTGTPEAVVQTYLQAVFDDDVVAARDLLADDVRERCPLRAFHQAWVPDAMSATLGDVRTDEQDGTVTVTVRLRAVEGPTLFGPGGFTTTEVFTVAATDGQWRIADDPWPLYDCEGRS